MARFLFHAGVSAAFIALIFLIWLSHQTNQTITRDYQAVYEELASQKDTISRATAQAFRVRDMLAEVSCIENKCRPANLDIDPAFTAHVLIVHIKVSRHINLPALTRLFSDDQTETFADLKHRLKEYQHAANVLIRTYRSAIPDTFFPVDQHSMNFFLQNMRDFIDAANRYDVALMHVEAAFSKKISDGIGRSTRVIFYLLLSIAGTLPVILFASLRNQALRRKAFLRIQQSEERIRNEEQKFRQLAENIEEVFWIGSPGWNEIRYISPAFEKIWGLACEELYRVPRLWLSRVLPEDRKAVVAAIPDSIGEEKEIIFPEYRIQRPNGEVRWIFARAYPVRNSAGDTVSIVGIAEDITHRKTYETALRKEKERAEQYLELSGVMFISLDSRGRIVMANAEACRILECGEESIIGMDWFSHFIPVSMREEVRDVFHRLMNQETASKVAVFENPILTLTGREKQIIWHNTFLTDDKGRLNGILSSGRDITEQRLLETRLREARKMETIGNLAGGIAHDFNNLLYPIIGMAELLLDDLPPKSQLWNNAREILNAGIRGGELVQQILSFSRRSDHRREPVRIQDVLEEVLNLKRVTLPTNIRISEQIDKDCPPVSADPVRIHQIAMNLITNAAHAMEADGGRLKIRLDREDFAAGEPAVTSLPPGRYAVLTVSDTGCGIEPALQEKIFEPYFTTKERGKGTGLGLAAVYGIVQEYGGDIRMSSTPGEGTTFIIRIPVLSADESGIAGNQNDQNDQSHTDMDGEPISPAQQTARLPGGSERILLVDDEPAIAELETLLLTRLGYTVTADTDSRETINTFLQDPDAFDLLITDMTMPHINGDQLVERVRDVRPGFPVIICTGFSEKMSEDDAGRQGINAYLLKPVIQKDMAETVRRVLEQVRIGK